MRWKTSDFNDHSLIQKPEFIDEIHDSSSDSKPIAELLFRFLNYEEPFVVVVLHSHCIVQFLFMARI